MSSRDVVEQAHRVQFFDHQTSLVERVGAFLGEALRDGGSAIAIVRADNRAAIESQLRAAGIDLESAKLTLLDADATLALLMAGGMPDAGLFDQHIGTLMRSRGGHVHAYGEMVDVLWSTGRCEAVVRLEQLWCELFARQPFTLLCGYRLRHDGAPWRYVVGPPSEGEYARTLLLLEQRACALEIEVERRTKLESRMLGLLELSGRLSAAHTRDEVAQLTIESGMKSVEAVSAALWIVTSDGNDLELCAGETVDHLTRIPITSDVPLAVAVREGRPIFLGSLTDYEHQFPASFERSKPSHLAFAILPVTGETRRLGGIAFAYDREREFGGPERTFKEVVARHCGLALERVEAMDKEQRSRAETELLYALTSEFGAAQDLEAVYHTALATVMIGTRSDRAAILLLEPDAMRFKAWRNLSETYRAAVEGHSPWRADTPNPSPITVDDTELDEAWAPFRPVFRAEGIHALAFIPLVHRKRLIGKFMLYRDEPRPFAAREVQLAATVAFHVGEALARKADEAAVARALAEEKEAHTMAEEATRAREEIISVVSHDLRNPLGAILIGASSLLQVDVDRRVTNVAARIHRQAERMARQIEDLVDFAGIQAGRLAIETKDHSPTEIIHAATDLFAALAQERGLTLETRVQDGLPTIQCDSDRALQVISNLMSNALKVTPKGGFVKVGVEAREREIVFFVNDTGPGIDSTELPKLFERYWRGKSSQYRGAGLGLSIARGIVDAHGGKIWAESTLGVGSTFFFSLAPSN